MWMCCALAHALSYICAVNYSYKYKSFTEMTKQQFPHDGNGFAGCTLKATSAAKLGGIPNSEIDAFAETWTAFPSLRDELFIPLDEHTSQIRDDDPEFIVFLNKDFNAFGRRFDSALADLPYKLRDELFVNYDTVNPDRKILEITTLLMTRVEPFESLIDSYEVRQLLEKYWKGIVVDIKILQDKGLDAAKLYYPSGGAKGQCGWRGYILPLDLVQDYLLPDKVVELETSIDALDEAKADDCTSEQQANLETEVARCREQLLAATFQAMDNLTDEQIIELLHRIHLTPLFDSIRGLSMQCGYNLINTITTLQTFYSPKLA
jgi:hypothetical protein